MTIFDLRLARQPGDEEEQRRESENLLGGVTTADHNSNGRCVGGRCTLNLALIPSATQRVLPSFCTLSQVSTTLRETPLTSPERAQRVARHAERERRDLGSPPMRRQPYRTVTVPENPPPALMMHPPVPLNRFPGMPRNIIEQHEMQRTWRAHHSPPPSSPPPPPHPPPPPMQPHGYAPELPPGPMQAHGFVPVLQPMHPYGFVPMVPPLMPPMQPQGLAPPPPMMQPPSAPVHGDIFYEGKCPHSPFPSAAADIWERCRGTSGL
ncbi:hypothetical protein BU15DRAFT_67760 [Melanogaster broomeanus]|nr:hypothetical protein BU15DRAFT_67760 [Melanogaster broomeanus]